MMRRYGDWVNQLVPVFFSLSPFLLGFTRPWSNYPPGAGRGCCRNTRLCMCVSVFVCVCVCSNLGEALGLTS